MITHSPFSSAKVKNSGKFYFTLPCMLSWYEVEQRYLGCKCIRHDNALQKARQSTYFDYDIHRSHSSWSFIGKSSNMFKKFPVMTAEFITVVVILLHLS